MRIAAGKFARRALAVPDGFSTRPTAMRTREAIFNILQHHEWGRPVPAGCNVLDACSGTGAMAFEALSRGAIRAWLIEKERSALQIARRNIGMLGVQTSCSLIAGDAAHPPPAPKPCDLIFCDPPYRKALPDKIIPALHAAGWFAPFAVLVLETALGETVRLPPHLILMQQRDYGVATVRFFVHRPPLKK